MVTRKVVMPKPKAFFDRRAFRAKSSDAVFWQAVLETFPVCREGKVERRMSNSC